MADNVIAEGRFLHDNATPGPYEVTADNGMFAHLQSLYRVPKDGWRERFASNMQSRNAAWTAWLLNNGELLLTAAADARTAIDAVQAAHESQLTQLAKDRAKAQRKIDRLEAELAAAQHRPVREFSDAEVLELAQLAWDRENNDVPAGLGYDWGELDPEVRDAAAAGIRAVLEVVLR